jgi:glutamate/tyrosine decarboxylase-like PLP-dependent enzyme
VNSISEGYFSSVNVAKHLKMKDLPFDSPTQFKLVAYYPESSQFWCRKALFIKEIHHQRVLPLIYHTERQNYTIDVTAFENQVKKDLSEGLIPFWFGASIGATAIGCNDPIDQIGKICKQYGLFLTVDAAYKGTSWVCPEYREETEGL